MKEGKFINSFRFYDPNFDPYAEKKPEQNSRELENSFDRAESELKSDIAEGGVKNKLNQSNQSFRSFQTKRSV